jgi:hypothetical protein
MEKEQLVTFIDSTGRTILGTLVEKTASTLIVKNPAILFVQPTQDGKLNVQTIPLYFREFIGDKNKNEGTKWEYQRATITEGLNIDNDSRLVNQYNTLFASQVPTQPAVGEPKVIRLFDE